MTDYDRWLDEDLDNYYADIEDIEILWTDEPVIEPNTDYDNYDGWDDIQ